MNCATPVRAARELDDLALERVQRRIERADVAHQRAAGLGEIDAAGAPVEQPDAQARLEVGQALAGRGQRQVLALGAARDAARLGDGQDEIERDEVEAHGWSLEADLETAGSRPGLTRLSPKRRSHIGERGPSIGPEAPGGCSGSPSRYGNDARRVGEVRMAVMN